MANPRFGSQGICYVCNPKRRCLEVRGREEHHVIPEHLGGKDGPLVTLCTTEHKEVHDLANLVLKGHTPVSPNNLLQEEWMRRTHLAAAIVRATKVTLNDPNRKIKFEARISLQENALLQELKKRLGCKSNDVLLSTLIQKLSSK